eukprot:UN18532
MLRKKRKENKVPAGYSSEASGKTLNNESELSSMEAAQHEVERNNINNENDTNSGEWTSVCKTPKKKRRNQIKLNIITLMVREMHRIKPTICIKILERK